MTSGTATDGGYDADRSYCGDCGFSVLGATDSCPFCGHDALN